ncbi:uncharacterized protein SAMN02910369_01855 [Lachnospiraceae bacterium NE2001]|nr:uncharacterized protein SAMN02910369_01855 [Lachnospiraceae bacterium NE2001]
MLIGDSREDMMMENIINKAIDYITELFKGNADGHDLSHTMRVYRMAVRLADSYPEADILVVRLAALLHDADDHKLFNTENNANARAFLIKQELDEEIIDQICEVINSVSFSKNKGRKPDTLEGFIVQDADRLDALGAIGIARTFSYGGKHGRTIEDSSKHFYEKLLLLKDQMNTPEALKIAEERHLFIESYIEELNNEMQ